MGHMIPADDASERKARNRTTSQILVSRSKTPDRATGQPRNIAFVTYATCQKGSVSRVAKPGAFGGSGNLHTAKDITDARNSSHESVP
eukprot:1367202-Rhodomonas_salina.2